MLLCAVLAFTIAGCGNTYTDENDYANFIRWQARYETEKELVGLLRDYDAAYRSYTTFIENSKDALPNNDTVSLAFVFEGHTILTDENIKLVQSGYNVGLGAYLVTFTFDSIGSAIFADITSNNIGGTIEIVETRNAQSNVLSAPVINSAITNGVVQINGFTEADANELYMRIASNTAERSVRRAASAYNDKRSKSATLYSMPEYLPASLAIEPQYVDVSAYLQKAEDVGFIA